MGLLIKTKKTKKKRNVVMYMTASQKLHDRELAHVHCVFCPSLLLGDELQAGVQGVFLGTAE